MEYYSAKKKNETVPFAATWKDLEIIILSEVSQRKMSLICGLLKLIQMKLQTDLRYRKTKLQLPKGKGRGL